MMKRVAHTRLSENRLRPWKVVLAGAAIAVLLLDWYRVSRPSGDFPLHWEFGRRFAAGEYLYTGGLHVPYPPFWAMVCAPLSVAPETVAQLLVYPVGVAALGALLFLLHLLTRDSMPIERRRLFWVIALALVLASRFIHRDLLECGPNLVLTALTWGTVYCWVRGRDATGGLLLGLAIALKLSPALFLAYFAWKRQWRLALAAAAAAFAFSAAPVLRQGPAEFGRHMLAWTSHLRRGLSDPDPSRGVLGEGKVQNFALAPVAARLLPRPAAAVLVPALTMGLLTGAAWCFRQPVKRCDDPLVLWECAAVSILMLLCSPITWGQHCVAVLPALYLLARTSLARGRLPAWSGWALGAWVFFVLILNYEVVGRRRALLLHAAGVTTWMLVMLFVLVVACRPATGACARPVR